MKRAILLVAALLAAALTPSELHADVVMGPPDDCPAGSLGQSSHCGEWCQATECKADADCRRLASQSRYAPRPLSCKQAGLCVEHDEYDSCSGWSMGEPLERIIARNPCQTDADCIRPARCAQALRCLAVSGAATPTASSAASPAPSTSGAPSAGRCACSLPGAPSSSPSLCWLLFGVVALRLQRPPRRLMDLTS